MKQIIILYILIFTFNNIGYAQEVIITGNAKTYAGDELVWKTYSDQITFTEKKLATCKVEKNGNFKFTINIKSTKVSFIHLSVFKGLLYIEPGKSYNIVLPEKVTKLPEDELNPFFEETEFFIRCTKPDTTELNYLIKRYDKLYNFHLTKSFNFFKGSVNKAVIDSIVELIEKKVPYNNNKYFTNYKKYNYAAIRLMAYERNRKHFLNKYFAKKEILFNNTAYMDLFNRVFNNHLSILYKDSKGKLIPYNLIKQKSISSLKSTLDSFTYLTNDTLKEMVILKSLFDNFYKEDFPRKSILFMIDSIEHSTLVKDVKITAKNIKTKLTKLLPNYYAPKFKLRDINGNLVSLDKYKNEFVYLNFCNPASYSCQKDFKTLQQLNIQKYELFNIVTICVCNSFDEMKYLVEKNNFNWTFLYYEKDNDLLKDYKIRVYPSYYLINPEGKLIMSPAFPPTEASFEARYFDTLKAWKIELERRKAEKKKKGLGNN